MKIRITKKNINVLFLLVIICWYIHPMISNYLKSYGLVLLFFLWFISSDIKKTINSLKSLVPFLIWWLFLLILNLFGLFSYGQITPLYFFTMTMFSVLPCLLFKYYCDDLKNPDFNKLISNFILFLLLLVTISTLITLRKYPLAVKIMAMGDNFQEQKQQFSRMGCGGYGFIFSIVITFPLFFYKKENDVFWVLIKVLFLITSLIVVFLSQYTIALLLLVFGTCLSWLIIKVVKGGNIYVCIIVLFAIILLIILFPLFLEFIIPKLSQHVVLQTRLSEVLMFIKGDSSGANLSGRFMLYGTSSKSFLKHPLFGSIFSDYTEIGGHSSILDTLAYFGIIGCSGYIVYIANTYKSNTALCNRFYKVGFLVFIIISLLDTSIYVCDLNFAFSFIVPLITLSLGDKRESSTN